MTLDEHENLEMALLKAKQNKQSEYLQEKQQFLKEEGIEDEEDSDDEKVSDMKRIKERNWDDWKDLNDKGEGNRNRH